VANFLNFSWKNAFAYQKQRRKSFRLVVTAQHSVPNRGPGDGIPAQAQARLIFRFAFVFDFSKYVIYAFS
jgi:hypothetical protein